MEFQGRLDQSDALSSIPPSPSVLSRGWHSTSPRLVVLTALPAEETRLSLHVKNTFEKHRVHDKTSGSLSRHGVVSIREKKSR